MRYRVRSPDGEVVFLNRGELEKAYAQGLVSPTDEVLEIESEKVGPASRMLGPQRMGKPAKATRAQYRQTLIIALLAGMALYLSTRGTWRSQLTGGVLALVVASQLMRVTYQAYARRKP